MEQTSDYKLRYEDREAYLVVSVEAKETTIESAVSYLNELMASLRRSGHRRLLLIREASNTMPEGHLKIIAAIMINLLPSGVRFALVDLTPSFQILQRVIARSAAERGREVKVFADRANGEAWLLG